ncbi:GntR family transcriptional regulator [Variovorax sp. J22G21]|uniref:GntR family transcriptional regulator n=1 Tax=Variovorax fucosicus TaxID=3053517 RepID=UPI0025786CAA|nr:MULTISPECIES: GntR family transcriptional regulator [unclassified Variovorax]MDM0037863.1 GntR family transcriptional regulator [Variovorax sp. J22R193]MDM0056469.1 GntR family transcriptional regulator [Variovorax sp. J22G47]MDM0062639.1 GntR family transcriptional regulator [Variovorax sp. J22G21]
MADAVTPTTIAERVVEAILAQKLAPGERLGEQALAGNFGVSRTMVREALMQLQARGFVEVQSKRGWYVVQPSAAEARDAFAARRIVEAGILAEAGKPLQKVIKTLRAHIVEEQRAIEGADAATRAFLLADFHVCLAQQMGHRLLVDVLRDLTARTTLAATLYQSKHEAGQSCAEHGAIVAALEAGNTARARELMIAHIGNVEEALQVESVAAPDAPARLRATLMPVARSGASR